MGSGTRQVVKDPGLADACLVCSEALPGELIGFEAQPPELEALRQALDTLR